MAQQEGFKLLVTGIPKEIPENDIQVSNSIDFLMIYLLLGMNKIKVEVILIFILTNC